MLTALRSTVNAHRWRRGFLASGTDPLRCTLLFVKDTGPRDPRLSTFVAALADLPPLPDAATRRVLALAQSYDSVRERIDWPEQGNPTVPDHLRISSSTGRKGRLLAALVQAFRPQHVLEIGTAYGLSSAFLLEAGPDHYVTTIETWSPMKELSQARLDETYGARVTCAHEPIQAWLVRNPTARFDALFHDGWHSAEVYRQDFAAIEPHLRPGSVILFDDIAYDHGGTYPGWQSIVAHPRVTHALDIDGELGAAVLR